jgi:tetratricopeptide (TPR) repeat protein
LEKQGKLEKAIEIIEEALDKNNNSASLWFRLAGYLYKNGKVRQAYVFIEKALNMDFNRYEELVAYLPELEKEIRFIELLEIYKNS